jgi:ABC-type methionine transport system permease subunit
MSSCSFVYCTVCGSVLELIAKPSHTEASVLCKVLGTIRNIFYETSMNFLCLIDVFMSLRCWVLSTGVSVTETANSSLF